MTESSLPLKSQSALAERLLRERDTVSRSNARRDEIIQRVRKYEAKYAIASSDVHDAIDRGQLKETQEVGRWIMDYELLRKIEGRSTR